MLDLGSLFHGIKLQFVHKKRRILWRRSHSFPLLIDDLVLKCSYRFVYFKLSKLKYEITEIKFLKKSFYQDLDRAPIKSCDSIRCY